MRTLELRRHTMRTKPGQHLSQAGVDLARLVGSRIGPFDRVITSPVTRAFETALAMGFAVDEQVGDLSAMPEDAEDEVGSWDAGFAAWARAVKKDGAAARYGQTLADLYRRIAGALPEGGAALIISHGGIVEAGAVAAAGRSRVVGSLLPLLRGHPSGVCGWRLHGREGAPRAAVP
jgi:broad specificity phosphatase PhoE